MKTKEIVHKPKKGPESQEAYVQSIKSGAGEDLSFFVTETVMESMRDNGYRDVRKALNDLIDNSQQADAKKIAVITTSGRDAVKGAREKITNIAVIDDGHGITESMLPYAIKWGGTDRHNQRDGLGRFGFGLPTASISVTRSYEVYSRVKGKDWYVIRVDLDEITQSAIESARGGKATFNPKAEKAQLPDFVKDYIKTHWKKNDLEQGTVVALLKPDRIRRFAMPQAFQTKMLQNIGLTYRHFMPDVTFFVNEKKVDMVDPLFLHPACIGYDAGNGIMAEGYEPETLRVKNKLASGKEVEGNVTLRFSYMPPEFQKDAENKLIPVRFNPMKENNGYFIVCRSGRQIDVVKDSNYQHGPDNITIVNYDRNWAIELDFEPELDELFGITTNKQQVEIDDMLWDVFKTNSIPAIIKGFRDRWKKEKVQIETDEEKAKNEERESEQVMSESEKFDQLELPEEKEEEAEKNKKNEATKRAKKNKTTVTTELEKIEEESKKSKYRIDYAENPGAPFYSVEMVGPQVVVKFNTAHRFYTDIYLQQNASGKTALELLIMVLGKCEIEATEDRLLFYKNERFEWSHKLELRLDIQDKRNPVADKRSADEAETEVQPEE